MAYFYATILVNIAVLYLTLMLSVALEDWHRTRRRRTRRRG